MLVLATALLASFLVATAPKEIQDAGFRVLDPSAHASLAAAVPDLASDQVVLDEATDEVRGIVRRMGIDATVTSRVKSLLSTHRKMQKKGLHIDKVRDRLAMRVYVQSVDECYAVYNAIHQAYAPVAGEQDDYIASPKVNGYRSLHTAVHVPGEVVEIQVRTHAMHQQAETGSAAHWRYKLA